MLGLCQIKIDIYSQEWSPYILGETFKWISLSKSWIEAPVETLVVHYEELRLNVTSELERICQFLNISCYNLNTTCFHVSSLHIKIHIGQFVVPIFVGITIYLASTG